MEMRGRRGSRGRSASPWYIVFKRLQKILNNDKVYIDEVIGD
jgi:hypothetical protein